ncbi:cdkn1a interacting zinc finger protein 1b [Symphorus nematophorus]
MVKQQQRRTDRCFVPAAVNTVTRVRFPVGPVQRRAPLTQQVSGRKWAGPGTGSSDRTTATEEEEGGDPGPDGGDSGETETKRARMDGPEQTAALTNRDKAPGSCGQPGSESGSTGDAVSSRLPPPDQQGSAELSEDSRAAELQSVASLKVTIQQSSESREFGQTDRTADRQTGGLHCHVCDLTCRSVQVFQEHMAGSEHLRRLKDITHSISVNTTHTLQDRGRRPDTQRWCDTCQTHFSGDVIIHRRTKQHKMCKQLCRPFCPVCRRHFRTPRKFVEHMKSAEHKQQVHLEEGQEEELITVDAVGCFEEEDEEEEEEEEEVEVADEVAVDVGGRAEEEAVLQAADTQETHREEYDPHTAYGRSFVVPVSGFLCRLCNKFFYSETTARHTHCRTHTHYLNLQSHRAAQRTTEDKDTSSLT